MPVAAPVTTMVRFVSRSCVLMAISWVGYGCRVCRGLSGSGQEIQPDQAEYGTPCACQNIVSTRAVNRRIAWPTRHSASSAVLIDQAVWGLQAAHLIAIKIVAACEGFNWASDTFCTRESLTRLLFDFAAVRPVSGLNAQIPYIGACRT